MAVQEGCRRRAVGLGGTNRGGGTVVRHDAKGGDDAGAYGGGVCRRKTNCGGGGGVGSLGGVSSHRGGGDDRRLSPDVGGGLGGRSQFSVVPQGLKGRRGRLAGVAPGKCLGTELFRRRTRTSVLSSPDEGGELAKRQVSAAI